MATVRILADDVVRLYDEDEKLAATLFWGDRLKQVGGSATEPVFDLVRTEWDDKRGGYRCTTQHVHPKRPLRFQDAKVLKVRFVDVGQGDGAIVEFPNDQRVLIDGGEGPWFRRYVARAYAHVLKTKPLHCDAIVVTHGDADHYEGLIELAVAKRNASEPLISTDVVFHNGLAKATGSNARQIFGKTKKVDGTEYAVELVDDLRKLPAGRLNSPFRSWQSALQGLGKIKVRRVSYGDDDAFDFITDENARIQVLGPITEDLNGAPALPLLHTPGKGSLSGSHTINGHSVILKLTYGNVRFLFGADLNEEAEERLATHARNRGDSLAAEILKVPHHGSADFSPRMLEAVRPVVSVISSGDESTSKEYIHPRAGLVGALGKYSRANVEKPLIYVTEMVAFFRRVKHAVEKTGKKERVLRNPYEKIAFGIVHVRTDGTRVLVVTHSGKDDQKESYAFTVNDQGAVTFETTNIT